MVESGMFSYEAATSRIGLGIGNSCALVWRWRGSLFQLLWKHFVAYFVISVLLGVIYRYALEESQQQQFDKFATYCKQHAEGTVLTLILTFFTGSVMTRWTTTCQDLPSTTPLIRAAVLYFARNENGEKSRRVFTRYILLTWLLCMRSMSIRLNSEYPTLDPLLPLGLLRAGERELLEEAVKQGLPAHVETLSWIFQLIQKSKEDGLFSSPQDAGKLSDMVATFEKSCDKVLKFQKEVTMPLPFTQVVIISVYLYGVTNLLGAQFAPSETLLRGFFPFLPSFKFFTFLIWMRMGVIFLNPFGKDETDLDTVWLWEKELRTAEKVLFNSEAPQIKQLIEEAMQENKHALCAPTNLQILASVDETKTATT